MVESEIGLTIGTTSISKVLQGCLYSLKLTRYVPSTANNATNKALRKQFVERLLEYSANQTPILCMDENNFNLFITRTKGRSLIGQRTNAMRPTSRGKNIHLVGAIGSNGFRFFETRRGSFTHDLSNEFIRRCMRSANQYFEGQSILLIIDNAPCHTRAEEVFQEQEFSTNYLLRLGPYSPMLNPIENLWAEIKSNAKRKLASRLTEILTFRGEPNLSATEYRLQSLETIINESLSEFTVGNIVQYFAGVQRHYASVINCEDVIF